MSTSRKLHPEQEDLVNRLLTREAVRLALVAPAGAGKTRAVLAAIERFLVDHPSAPALVVAPASLGTYVAEALRSSAGIRVRHLKGSNLRLLGETSASLAGGAYFVTTELARQAWARDVIGSLPWSLAFVDEATTGGPGVRDLIEQLRIARQTERLCVVLSYPRPEISKGFELVTWDLGQTLRLPREAELIPYRRLPGEMAVRERLGAVEQEFGAEAVIRRTLEAAWRSSASSFEFVLARHASMLGALHDAQGGRDPLLLGRAQELGGGDIRSHWRNPEGARLALQQLATQVGQLDCDSKLEACLAYVVPTLRYHKVALFTAMRQTALYLHAAVDAEGILTSVIDGSRAEAERVASEHAQVVVLTDAVVPAVGLTGAFFGISYDLPWSSARLDARWATLEAIDGKAVMAILVDESRVDPIEEELARTHSLLATPEEASGISPDESESGL